MIVFPGNNRREPASHEEKAVSFGEEALGSVIVHVHDSVSVDDQNGTGYAIEKPQPQL